MGRKADFSSITKKILGEQVAYRCSRCDKLTIGPHSAKNDKSISLGEAAHIFPAEKGPRYDADRTIEELKKIENGIWLCSNCHTLIDADDSMFTIQELQQMKISAKNKASQRLLLESSANLSNEMKLELYPQIMETKVRDLIFHEIIAILQPNNYTLIHLDIKKEDKNLFYQNANSFLSRLNLVIILFKMYTDDGMKEKIQETFYINITLVNRFILLCNYYLETFHSTNISQLINGAKEKLNEYFTSEIEFANPEMLREYINDVIARYPIQKDVIGNYGRLCNSLNEYM